ncbi:hypothetical protein J3458_005210 [Metarhizium acridum]|uniref:uncharacterized protein n=1 Tax=Metarhizium acridum TaxID=92637 RepID=UPI001C6D1E7E|nr:hypothetical protein J3458_005210 [Metarhizium acridum]
MGRAHTHTHTHKRESVNEGGREKGAEMIQYVCKGLPTAKLLNRPQTRPPLLAKVAVELSFFGVPKVHFKRHSKPKHTWCHISSSCSQGTIGASFQLKRVREVADPRP